MPLRMRAVVGEQEVAASMNSSFDRSVSPFVSTSNW